MNKIWPWVGIPLGIGVLLLLMAFWTSDKGNDIKIGQGRAAKLGDRVIFHMTWLSNTGAVLQDSRKKGQPVELVLEKKGRRKSERENPLIDRLVDTLIGMKEGGIRKITMSSETAVGKQDLPPGMAGTDLNIEIELVKIKQE